MQSKSVNIHILHSILYISMSVPKDEVRLRNKRPRNNIHFRLLLRVHIVFSCWLRTETSNHYNSLWKATTESGAQVVYTAILVCTAANSLSFCICTATPTHTHAQTQPLHTPSPSICNHHHSASDYKKVMNSLILYTYVCVSVGMFVWVVYWACLFLCVVCKHMWARVKYCTYVHCLTYIYVCMLWPLPHVSV